MARTGRGSRGAGALCAAALLLAGCTGGSEDPEGPTVPTGGDAATAQPTGDATEVPDPVPTTLPGPGEDSGEDPGDGDAGTAAPGEGATDTGGPDTERAVLTRLEFEIPADWRVEDMGDAQPADPQAGQIAPHLWCLVPPGDLAPVDGCGGVVVAIGGDWLPGAGGSRYQPNQAGGWWSGQDEPACPFGQDPEGEDGEGDADAGGDGAGPADPADTANDGLPLTSQSTTVGEHAVRYETWRVDCETSGQTLTPQLWHLPELNVLVKDYYGHPDTVAVLHGLEGS